MKWWYGWVVAIGLAIWLFWPSPTVVQQPGTVKTDTVYRDRPPRVDTVMLASAPRVVYIYPKDSLTRVKAEKSDIITRVEFTEDKLSIYKVTPPGVTIQQDYQLPGLSSVLIDGNGQAQILPDKSAKRKRFWRKVELIGVGVAGIFIGTKI